MSPDVSALRRPTRDLSRVLIASAVAGDLEVSSTLIQTSGAYQGPYLAQVKDRTLDVDYLHSTIMRVARDEHEEVVGFYSLDTPGRGGSGEADLDWMIVRDDWQGAGLGRALLHDAIRTAADQGLSALIIVAHPPASAFYRRCGAVPVGVLEPQGRATWKRDILHLDLPR